MTLASTYTVFLLPLPMCFRCCGTLKFPKTYNGKIDSRPLFLSYCKALQKCALNCPLLKISFLFKPLTLTGCYVNRNTKFAKSYSNKFSSEAIGWMKLKLCINVHDINFYINYVSTAVADVLASLWQLKVSIGL